MAEPSAGPAPARNRLGMVEAGRALAALAVVLFHADTMVSAQVHGAPTVPLFVVGERGVDFFFVLSGFIITFVHAQDIGHRNRAVHFLKKRFVRIYPLLWLMVGANVAMNMVVDLEVYPFAKLWTSFTLWPSLVWPSPAVAWTLRHEMLFYTLFALAIASRGAGMALAGSWLLATLWQTGLLLSGHSFPGLAAMLFSPLNLQFAAGCFVAWSFGRFDGRFGPHCLALGTLALLAIVAAWFPLGVTGRHALDYQNPRGAGIDLCFAAIFGLIVYGLAHASRSVTVPRTVLLLGAASYAIYLVHTPVLGLAGRFLTKVLPASPIDLGASHLVLFLLAIVAGLSVHILFERPVGRLIGRRLFAPRGRAQAEIAEPASAR